MLPLYLDSNLHAGYSAYLRSSIGLGVELSPGPLGFGIAARDYSDFRSMASLDASAGYSLLSGFHADMRSFFWRRKVEGGAFLPYLTLNLSRDGLRLYANAGPEISIESGEERTIRHHGFANFPGESGSERESIDGSLSSVRVMPALSFVAAPENAGEFFPVFSVIQRDRTIVRGAFGLHLDRAYLRANADTGRNASGELLLLINGDMGRREYQDYVFANETATAGFFPAYRTRMMLNRHRLITSAPKLLFRSAMDYDAEIDELSAENGVMFSRGNFFLDSGVRLFSAENFGAGLYNSIGTRDFFTTQSFSTSFGGGPSVQTFIFSMGGTIR